jgi:hypothetical protein
MTGNDVMQEAMLLVQRIRNFNQTASVDDIATCQIALNNLLDEMNSAGISVYSTAPVLFVLSTGQASYSVGPGGNINIPRPVKVESWNIRTSSGQAIGGKPVDALEFAMLAADRSAQGARVKALNYDAAFPLASVHLYPIPNGGTLELWVWSQLAPITNFASALNYPPGYLQAIVYNLAMAIGPKFERPVDPGIKIIADGALAALGATNASQHPTPAAPPAAQ